MISFTGTYTDYYQLTMAQVYFLKGHHKDTAIFDYFFRKLPFGGGFAIFAGLEDLLDALEHLSFEKDDLEFLKQQQFDPALLEYLKTFKFTGTIYACQEGEVVFPIAPIIRIEANIIEAQIIETLLLNIINFQTLIATKASRMRLAAGNQRQLIDFGLRRAQGAASYYASRAAIIGGFNATSHVRAGLEYQIPVSGTMAHSIIQSYENELDAFRDFAAIWPEDCLLLVDTYNTLESGVPNAIKIAKEMERRGQKLQGIRLDSGDLAYLAKQSRQQLNDASLDYVKIVVSNKLDENIIKSLLEQNAPIDSFGVGTNLAIGKPDGALDGVYKLACVNHLPRIKISESLGKITLPYKKQVYRALNEGGAFWGADCIALNEETEVDRMYHPFEPIKSVSLKNYPKETLLHKVFANGKRLFPKKSLHEISQFRQNRLDLLPEEYKRFHNPHIYKVGLSEKLLKGRLELIKKYQGS